MAPGERLLRPYSSRLRTCVRSTYHATARSAHIVLEGANDSHAPRFLSPRSPIATFDRLRLLKAGPLVRLRPTKLLVKVPTTPAMPAPAVVNLMSKVITQRLVCCHMHDHSHLTALRKLLKADQGLW